MTGEAEANRAKLGVTEAGAETPEQQASSLAQRLAGLVPSEVLIAYGIGLALAVTRNADGSTTVTRPGMLKWSIPILAALSLFGFLVTKTHLTRVDAIRMLIPPLAFVAWTLLTGSSALSLWKRFDWVAGIELYVGAVVGVVALFLSIRFTVKNP
jgi:hypothetical protein